MFLKPLRTEQDHATALRDIARLMALDPAAGTPDGDALDILVTLTESYEAAHVAIPLPDPIEAIAVRLADKHMSPSHLDAQLGRPGATADVLARRRPMTVEMIRVFAQMLDLPAEVLIQPYRLAVAAE